MIGLHQVAEGAVEKSGEEQTRSFCIHGQFHAVFVLAVCGRHYILLIYRLKISSLHSVRRLMRCLILKRQDQYLLNLLWNFQPMSNFDFAVLWGPFGQFSWQCRLTSWICKLLRSCSERFRSIYTASEWCRSPRIWYGHGPFWLEHLHMNTYKKWTTKVTCL